MRDVMGINTIREIVRPARQQNDTMRATHLPNSQQ